MYNNHFSALVQNACTSGLHGRSSSRNSGSSLNCNPGIKFKIYLKYSVVVNKKCAKKAEKIKQLKNSRKYSNNFSAEKSEQFWTVSAHF